MYQIHSRFIYVSMLKRKIRNCKKKKSPCPLLEVPCLNMFKVDRRRGFKSENQRILSL